MASWGYSVKSLRDKYAELLEQKKKPTVTTRKGHDQMRELLAHRG